MNNYYCCCHKVKKEPAFVRPNDGTNIWCDEEVALNTQPIIDAATPTLLYALGKTDNVNTTIFHANEYVIESNSSGVIPYQEAQKLAKQS